MRYLGCNVEFERFWGISLDSILNKTAKEIFDSKTIVSKADRTDKLVLKNKSAITYEDTLVLKSGIQKTVFVKKALYLKGDGTVGGIMGIITDITALREAEVRYRLLVDSSNDGIAITNDSLHIYANDKFANIFGYSSGKDIIGKGYEYVIHANDVQRVKRYTLQRRAGKNVDNHYIVRGVKKNGDIIYIDISVSLIIYKGLPASLAFVRDVTDRIVAQKELKMAEEQYRAIFENTGTGTCIIRNDMIITLVNNKFSQISGYTKEEIEGRMTWKDFFDVSVIEFMEKYHYARRRKGGPIIAPNQYTTVFVDRWGDKKYVLLTADIIPSTTDSIASITILPDHYVPLPFKEL
ncbi:MAG: PAS domain S-box protein [Pseudomonadota bacterium]|nr:PAS domain S-box protein [Pseudomonadota bacterium]